VNEISIVRPVSDITGVTAEFFSWWSSYEIHIPFDIRNRCKRCHCPIDPERGPLADMCGRCAGETHGSCYD